MDPTTYGVTDPSNATTATSDRSLNERRQQSSPQQESASDRQRVAAKTDEVKEKMQQQIRNTTEAAKQKALEAANRARQSERQHAHEKKHRVADEIGIFSSAIRKASHKLHEEQHDSIASYVDAAAEQLDHFRESLQSRDLGTLIDVAQRFTRRHPEVVYGGFFIAGLAAVRFLKASRPTENAEPSLSEAPARPPTAYGHATGSTLPPSTVPQDPNMSGSESSDSVYSPARKGNTL